MISTESNTILPKLMKTVDNKFGFFTNHVLISIVIICGVSFILRLYFFEPEIPIRQDATAYFHYAMDMSILKTFPYTMHANDGWPIFLSIFFGIFNFNSYLDYSILQKIISIVISTLTIIPIYFLCRRFFDRSFSVVGASLFAFEPHLIQNSLLGITEPLYLLLAVSSLTLFLSKNQKLFYCSFAITALVTIVRAEGIIILIILLVTFFVNNRKEKKTAGIIFLAIIIFSAIFVPMMIIKSQSSGVDLTSLHHITSFSYGSIADPENNGVNFSNLLKSVETMIKRLGQSMIPYFAFFVPFGIVLLFKNRNKENNLIIISLLIYSLIVIRMFFVVGDLRFIFFLYPLFIILSLHTIKHLGNNIEFKKIFLVGMMGAILLLSWFFLYSNIEYDYEKEAIQFAGYMVNNVKVSNNFYPESGMIDAVWASSNLKVPILLSDLKYTGPHLLDYVKDRDTDVYLVQSANSVEEYIKLAKDQNLSHLVIDSNEKRPSYFKDVFYHEEKYPYLIKEFDSFKEGYRYYNVKVFKIDYEYFNSTLKDN